MNTNSFQRRHIGPSEKEQNEMLEAIGVESLEQLIQETKTHYTYSELSLIAEIGGYVGLFLGISINQITNLVDILVVRIRSLFTLQ